MPKKIDISIKEPVDYLNKAYSKATSVLEKDRIKTLQLLASKKYHFQSDLAKKIGRNEKTIREWLKLYVTAGFSGLITVKSGGNNTRTLSDDVIDLIEQKVTDAHTTITSYVELKLLLEQQTNENIAYGALYSHCRRKFKTKLKVARKSHYKKDPNAEAFFKKPTKTI